MILGLVATLRQKAENMPRTDDGVLMRPHHCRILAVFVTLTAAGMAAAAAWGRGGTDVERALIVALSVAVVLAVHLLPALNRHWAGWVLWVCCLLAAVFAHLVFFTQASVHAGDIRGQQSARFTGTVQQIEATQAALDGIRARPVAVIAAEVAATDSWRQRRALEIEIQEARRAAALRDAVLRLSAEAVAARVADSADTTTDRIAAATGATVGYISLSVGLFFAVLVELLGAYLWMLALRQHPDTESPPSDPVERLRRAVEAGEVRPTTSQIRAYLKCGQSRALAVRRQFFQQPTEVKP